MNKLSTWIVSQSNRISSGCYTLSLLEMRLYHLCLMQIPRFSYSHCGYFKITAKAYQQLFGVNFSQAHKDVKCGLLSWCQKYITLRNQRLPWVQSVLLRWPKGYAVVHLHPALMHELTHLQASSLCSISMGAPTQQCVCAAFVLQPGAISADGFFDHTLSAEKAYHLSQSYQAWSALRTRLLEPGCV